jgi:endogenous inhibitor of DNA gyrase (YacG/DUF329 family)
MRAMREEPPTSPTRPPRPCPICGKRSSPRHYPFCSSRCARIDLGRWLKGAYRFATDEQPEGEEGGLAEP